MPAMMRDEVAAPARHRVAAGLIVTSSARAREANKPPILFARPEGFEPPTYRSVVTAALCIATDDPRLKEK